VNASSRLHLTDPAHTIDEIVQSIRHNVRTVLRRRGAVIAVSGGIDSSVCAALCVKSLGPDFVTLISLPDRHSSDESKRLAVELGGRLGVRLITEDIEPIVAAAGCYARQTESLLAVFPEYQDGWPFKIVLPSLLERERLNVPRITLRTASGELLTRRVGPRPYLQLVAATNFKQRTRTMMAFFHADSRNFAVCGTPNRLEYDQGFFVKGGDGLSDFAPIAHLYKTQVYELGHALDLPRGILDRQPTTDTFPLEQSQEEFYFSAPYPVLDLCMFALNNSIPAAEIAAELHIPAEHILRLWEDIAAKRGTTLPLHLPTLKVERIAPIDAAVDAAAGRNQ
jgi:NAD+ synthase